MSGLLLPPPSIDFPPALSAVGGTGCGVLEESWDTTTAAWDHSIVSNPLIYQDYLDEDPPSTCGDLTGTLAPYPIFGYTLSEAAYVQANEALRAGGGNLYNAFGTPGGQYAGANYLNATAQVDFDTYDVWTVGGRIVKASRGWIAPDSVHQDAYQYLSAQYWGHIDPPTWLGAPVRDSGYSTSGPVVKLRWSNHHRGGPQYQTEIDEGSAPGQKILDVAGTVDSALTQGQGGVTRTFWVRHKSTITNTTPPYMTLTWPASGWDSMSVAVAAGLNATIDGPDGIDATDTYEWDAGPQGGPGNGYHYQWFFQEYGDTIEKLANSDARYYARYVEQRESFWFFRLIVTLWDTADSTNFFWADSADMMIVYVDPAWGRSAPGTGAAVPELTVVPGFIDTDGHCTAIPDDQAARQALFRRLWSAAGPIRRCDATVGQPPRPGQ